MIDWPALLSLVVDFGAYTLAVCFLLFLLFMAWMVLEDVIEGDD